VATIFGTDARILKRIGVPGNRRNHAARNFPPPPVSNTDHHPSDGGPMLEARHLWKFYGGTAAVRDVSFVVDAGDIVGYLGANGSGKSTTARMIAGLITPSRGVVAFRGRDIAEDLVGYRRGLGYVPEESALYGYLSGREYLEFVGQLRGLPDAVTTDKIPALLRLFGIADAAELDIGSYSKGMKQKVLLISALMHDPDVLVLDEPESGLDVTAALVLRHLVFALARRGKAILYSSHVLDSVERLCTRVIVLHHGACVATGTSRELQTLLSQPTLEDVFAQLALRRDPESTARDIADVVTSRT
jgi:ABC-2 type transport system ATP-binding protein